MSDTEGKRSISRRDLLKVLGATGAGLVGSLLLPGKWIKPVSQLGVLPAHAQASLPVFDIIRSSEAIVFVPQEESYVITPTVYIDPPASGVLMGAAYEVEEFAANAPQVFGPPTALPNVATTAGAAPFQSFNPGFNWLNVRVTYKFVNPDNCNVTCEKVVVILRPPEVD